MKKRGLLVVVSSPSGGGKGTILKELFRRNENLKMSVSATTRAPRPGEEHGVHYYFITKDEFKTNIENHAMLEYAEYCLSLIHISAYLSMLGKKKPPESQKPEDTISKLITRRVVSVASQIVFVLRSLWKKRHVSLKELFRCV